MKEIKNVALAFLIYLLSLIGFYVAYRVLMNEEVAEWIWPTVVIVWGLGSVFFWLRVSQHLNARAWKKKLKKAHACPECKSVDFGYSMDDANDVETVNEELAPGKKAFMKYFQCNVCGHEYPGFLYYEDKQGAFGHGGVIYINPHNKKRRFNNPLDVLAHFRYKRQFFSSGLLAAALMSVGLYFLLTWYLGLYGLAILGISVILLFLPTLNVRVYTI